MHYQTVFNGAKMVYRKVSQKGRGTAVGTPVQAPPTTQEMVLGPLPEPKEQDKKALRLKYAAEINRIM